MDGWSRKKWILVYVFTVVLGTIFHFVYGFTGENRIVGYFFPINESTWEHMKLVYFPMLLCIWIFVKSADEKWMLGNIIGTWLIPVMFYTYKGILGFGVMAIDILNFYIAVFAAFRFAYHFSGSVWNKASAVVIRVLFIIQGIMFVVFTYHPLALGIFAEP